MKTAVFFMLFLFFLACSTANETEVDANGATDDAVINDADEFATDDTVPESDISDDTLDEIPEEVLDGELEEPWPDEDVSSEEDPIADDDTVTSDDDIPCTDPAAGEELNVPYQVIEGVDPNLLSLDIYRPVRADGCKPLPVVVWVHGGGWKIGDKANKMNDKIALFNGAGYMLVSINYRLSPAVNSTDPARVKYPVHEQDVAAALKWIYDNIASRGGDPSRIAILGHSAGAHLVALVGTDGSFLEANGMTLSGISCVGSFDTEGYDIPTTMQDPNDLYINAFGDDPEVWEQASPLYHVLPGKDIPPFLLVFRGTADRQAIEKGFHQKLLDTGYQSTIIDATSLTHEEVNDHIGMAGDTVMTQPVNDFLEECFK